MEITPLGDSALIVRVRDDFSAPEETLRAVLATRRAIAAAQIDGVVECTTAYTTVTVFYDPMRVLTTADVGGVFESLAAQIQETLSSVAAVGDRGRPRNVTEIPVCYDPEFAPDLDAVAQHANLSTAQVVDLHSGAAYCVACLGFTPGFPYLAGLPDELVTPRRATPRKLIPAGSVAIGGAQTGIYPTNSPGGWNIIGRTPLRLFDPQKNPPALLQPGERVRFRSITHEQFTALAK